MNKDDVKKLLEGTVEEIKPQLVGLSNADLKKLHDAEEQGENRSTLLHAIDAARSDDAKGSEVSHDYRASHPTEFEQGRRARVSAISKEDAPYDPSNEQHAAWLAGFDSWGPIANDPANEPMAVNQAETVAEANKA